MKLLDILESTEGPDASVMEKLYELGYHPTRDNSSETVYIYEHPEGYEVWISKNLDSDSYVYRLYPPEENKEAIMTIDPKEFLGILSMIHESRKSKILENVDDNRVIRKLEDLGFILAIDLHPFSLKFQHPTGNWARIDSRDYWDRLPVHKYALCQGDPKNSSRESVKCMFEEDPEKFIHILDMMNNDQITENMDDKVIQKLKQFGYSESNSITNFRIFRNQEGYEVFVCRNPDYLKLDLVKKYQLFMPYEDRKMKRVLVTNDLNQLIFDLTQFHF